jgi:hypothetical protein
MDRYSRAVLTVIAVALVAIAIKLWSMPNVPTVGDLIDAAQSNDEKAVLRVTRHVPLAKIQGTVDVTGDVNVNR